MIIYGIIKNIYNIYQILGALIIIYCDKEMFSGRGKGWVPQWVIGDWVTKPTWLAMLDKIDYTFLEGTKPSVHPARKIYPYFLPFAMNIKIQYLSTLIELISLFLDKWNNFMFQFKLSSATPSTNPYYTKKNEDTTSYYQLDLKFKTFGHYKTSFF